MTYDTNPRSDVHALLWITINKVCLYNFFTRRDICLYTVVLARQWNYTVTWSCHLVVHQSQVFACCRRDTVGDLRLGNKSAHHSHRQGVCHNPDSTRHRVAAGLLMNYKVSSLTSHL